MTEIIQKQNKKCKQREKKPALKHETKQNLSIPISILQLIKVQPPKNKQIFPKEMSQQQQRPEYQQAPGPEFPEPAPTEYSSHPNQNEQIQDIPHLFNQYDQRTNDNTQNQLSQYAIFDDQNIGHIFDRVAENVKIQESQEENQKQSSEFFFDQDQFNFEEQFVKKQEEEKQKEEEQVLPVKVHRSKKVQLGQNGHSQSFASQADPQATKKARLTNKLQQILFRRSKISSHQHIEQHLNQSPRTFNSHKFQDSRIRPYRKKKQSRSMITTQILGRLQIYFQQYMASQNSEEPSKIKMRHIAQKVGISQGEAAHLFYQYQKDPLFMRRKNKLTIMNKTNGLHPITEFRIQFLSQLLKRNGPLTYRQIQAEMNKDDSLKQRDKEGNLLPVSKKVVVNLMRIGKFRPKRMMQTQQTSLNSEQSIKNRYRYACKYLELTQQQTSDVCFLGQFSFANNCSLSNCPPIKMKQFIEGKELLNDSRVKQSTAMFRQGKKFQYLLVMSITGIVFYQFYEHILKQLNFAKTLTKIGMAMMSRNNYPNKYLILQNSVLHKKQDLKNFQKNFPIKVYFLPPKASQLNPTEYFFLEIKDLIKSRSKKGTRSVPQVLEQTLQPFIYKDMKSFFKCLQPYMNYALKQQPYK